LEHFRISTTASLWALAGNSLVARPSTEPRPLQPYSKSLLQRRQSAPDAPIIQITGHPDAGPTDQSRVLRERGAYTWTVHSVQTGHDAGSQVISQWCCALHLSRVHGAVQFYPAQKGRQKQVNASAL